MTIQMSSAMRNARVAAIETAIGTTPKVSIRSGTQPAGCSSADSGTEIIRYTLASDWSTQTSGVLTFTSTPISGTATGTATAAHYRIYATDGTTCHMQGTVTATGGGGDMTVDNTSVTTGQTVQITGWTITDGNP
jgi:hypothetical protein